PEVDVLAAQLGGVELGTLVEVDVEGIGIDEVLRFLRLEETLLGAATELLGVHPHLMGLAFLGHGQLFQTRTSPSYGSKVSISWGNTLRIATSSEARPMNVSLS